VRTIGNLHGSADSYDAIRTHLVDAFELPMSVCFRKIVKPGGMGDRRPSQLLRDMHNKITSAIGEDALKEYWLQISKIIRRSSQM